MKLRLYQHEAVAAVYAHLRERDDNPCVVIPTAGGKTPVMATICRDAVGAWGGRVLILAHVKELLQQAADKLNAIAPEMMLNVGVYSAGLGSRDTEHPIIIAGIQSVYQRAHELGAFDLIIVDEAHLIPPDGEGMYQRFLADARAVNPATRVIGLTATPFRMRSGMICGPENVLNHICYEISVRELIVQGYLCGLRSKAGREKPDTSGLHVRAGEFVAEEVEAAMDTDTLVETACGEIVEQTQNRHACLIFASGIKHGAHVAGVLAEKAGATVGQVYGDTPSAERETTLNQFRAGRLKFLVNVNVLTTGFDAPNVDCVVLLRPTMSPGLYYQMVGRSFRIHPGKENALVLDFGGNVLRHGPVDQIRVQAAPGGHGEAPAKECPQCFALIAAGYAVCPDCGHQFPPPERRQHDARAGEADILSGGEARELEVMDTLFNEHWKRDAPLDHPPSMRVEYLIGLGDAVSEWVCPEHVGYARTRFEAWWRVRSRAPVPDTVREAIYWAKAGALAPTLRITTTKEGKYDRVVGYTVGPIPAWSRTEREPGDEPEVYAPGDELEVYAPAATNNPYAIADDEIPF